MSCRSTEGSAMSALSLSSQALIFIRRATLAAETVLPASSRLKMDLYIKLAELTYQVSL